MFPRNPAVYFTNRTPRAAGSIRGNGIPAHVACDERSASTRGRVFRMVGTDGLLPRVLPPEARAERDRTRYTVRVWRGSDINPFNEGQSVVAARVLVADDEESIRKLLALALSDAGYEVATASDGVEAFQKIQDADLLVTDLKIGRMDGYELCKRVRQTSALPIIVISGGLVADEEPGGDASSLDADAVMRKPFDVMELIHLARSLVPPNGGELDDGKRGVQRGEAPLPGV